MTNKPRSVEDALKDKEQSRDPKDAKEKDLSPTNPNPDEPREDVERETPVVVKGQVKVEGDNEIREDRVENFDNTGNEITDNLPLDWDKAPAGSAIASGAVPSENAVVVNELPVAVYANENEFDDKGLKEEDKEEVEEPPVEEAETPARETHKVPVTQSPRSDSSDNEADDINKPADARSTTSKPTSDTHYK